MSGPRTVAVLAVAVALLAGCGGTDTQDGSGGAAGPKGVAWADDVCGAFAGLAQAAAQPEGSAQPTLDPKNPGAMVQQLGTRLSSTTAALKKAIDGLDAAGPAPIAGGDEYVSRLKETLTRVSAGYEAAAAKLAEVDTSSAASVTATLPAVFAPLQGLGDLAAPTPGLEANDELRAAAAAAPNCRQLQPS